MPNPNTTPLADKAGYCVVYGANLSDSSGRLLAGVKLLFTPRLASGSAIAPLLPSIGHATLDTVEVDVDSTGKWQTYLARVDVPGTVPMYFQYAVTALDPASGRSLLGAGYDSFQPAAPEFDFDEFQPNLQGQVAYVGGPAGPAGRSAYDDAVLNGFVGTELQWLASLKGKDGTPGTQAAGTFAFSPFLEQVLPASANILRNEQILQDFTINADGTLTNSAATNPGIFVATPLMLCPGAKEFKTNAPARSSGACNIATYDAAGNFLSLVALPGGAEELGSKVSCPLPGNQTYLRFGWATVHMDPNNGYVTSDSQVMVTAGTTANPSVFPNSFVSGDAIGNQIAAAVTPIDAALAVTPTQASLVSAILSRIPAQQNRFNPANTIVGQMYSSNGTLVANADQGVRSSGLIAADQMNNFVTNLPVRNQGTFFVCEYDYAGRFLDAIAQLPQGGLSRYTPGALIPLSGNQSFIAFSWYEGDMTQTSGYAMKDAQGFVLCGTTASPALMPPSLVPFKGFSELIIRKASELGCFLDIDPSTINHTVGNSISGLFHDDAAIINAFLAGASPTSPRYLFMDGVAAIGTSINISAAGYTTIDGIGTESCGFFLKQGANTDGIRIGAYVNDPNNFGDSEGTRTNRANLPAQNATAISLRNFTMFGQGNSGGASTAVTGANTPIAGAPSHLTYGIFLAHCHRVYVHNVRIFDSPSFALCLVNVSQVRISDCVFENYELFHDGVHLDGPWSDVLITNCLFATGDDAIAVNSNEGWGGDSSRLVVSNCTFRGCLTWSRLGYGSNSQGQFVNGAIQNVSGLPFVKTSYITFVNCVGDARNQPFNFGLGNLGTVDPYQLYDVTISNCTCTAPSGFALINSNVGTVVFRDCVLQSPTIPQGATDPVPAFILESFTATDLFISGFRINRTAEGNAAVPLLRVLGVSPPTGYTTQTSSYGRITLEHCRVCDLPGSSFAAIPYIISVETPVAQLNLNLPDLLHVAALCNPGIGWANVATATAVTYHDPRS